MAGFVVQGLDELNRLANQMEGAARGELQRTVTRVIDAEARRIEAAQSKRLRGLRRVPSDWKQAARQALTVRPVSTAKITGRRISVEGGNLTKRRAATLNSGRLRHPLFGNRDFWYQQNTAPGWFDRPTNRSGSVVRRKLAAELHDYLLKAGKVRR